MIFNLNKIIIILNQVTKNSEEKPNKKLHNVIVNYDSCKLFHQYVLEFKVNSMNDGILKQLTCEDLLLNLILIKFKIKYNVFNNTSQ